MERLRQKPRAAARGTSAPSFLPNAGAIVLHQVVIDGAPQSSLEAFREVTPFDCQSAIVTRHLIVAVPVADAAPDVERVHRLVCGLPGKKLLIVGQLVEGRNRVERNRAKALSTPNWRFVGYEVGEQREVWLPSAFARSPTPGFATKVSNYWSPDAGCQKALKRCTNPPITTRLVKCVASRQAYDYKVPTPHPRHRRVAAKNLAVVV